MIITNDWFEDSEGEEEDSLDILGCALGQVIHGFYVPLAKKVLGRFERASGLAVFCKCHAPFDDATMSSLSDDEECCLSDDKREASNACVVPRKLRKIRVFKRKKETTIRVPNNEVEGKALATKRRKGLPLDSKVETKPTQRAAPSPLKESAVNAG